MSAAPVYKTILTVLIIVGAVLYAPIYLALENNTAGAFFYFAPDAFYYLAVADRSMDAPFYTFDGQFPTNGFHPFWQYYLAGAFKFGQLRSQTQQVLFVFYSSILFVALGTGLFGVVLLRLTDSVPLTLISAVPGGYYLIFSNVTMDLGSQWSFINGMETPFSIFFFGLLLYVLIGRNAFNPFADAKVVIVSLLLTCLTLSRLDDIFLFVPFGGLLLLASRDRRARGKRLALFLIIPMLLIGGYLLYNLSYAGFALPVSGMAKGHISLLRNVKFIIRALLPNLRFPYDWWYWWWQNAWRVLQLCVPLLLAGAWLVSRSGTRKLQRPGVCASAPETLLTLLAGYVLLKGGYNLVNVDLWDQGDWYFPLSIMSCNLMIAVWLNHKFPLQIPRRIARIAVTLVVLLFILLIANSFSAWRKIHGFPQAFFTLWEARDALRQRLTPLLDGHGFIECDDGILAYALRDVPVLSGFGFTLDQEAFRAKQRGKLLPLAYQRGFRFLASLDYFKVFHNAEAMTFSNSQMTATLASFPFLAAQHLTPWQFSIAYRDTLTGVVFIRFEPLQH